PYAAVPGGDSRDAFGIPFAAASGGVRHRLPRRHASPFEDLWPAVILLRKTRGPQVRLSWPLPCICRPCGCLLSREEPGKAQDRDLSPGGRRLGLRGTSR